MSTSKLLEFIKTAKDLLSSYRFSNIQLSDKSLIQFQGEELKKGLAVNLLIDSKASPLPDGPYKTLDGITFTIDKGVISELSGNTTTAKTTPTLQAQSSQKSAQENSLDVSALPNYTNETIAKASGSKTVKQDDDSTEDGQTSTDDPDSNTDAPVTISVLSTALQPILDAIKNIENTMCSEMKADKEASEKMSKEIKDTREALTSVTEVVEILASAPSDSAIIPKKNAFKKEDKVDFEKGLTMKLFELHNKK